MRLTLRKAPFVLPGRRVSQRRRSRSLPDPVPPAPLLPARKYHLDPSLPRTPEVASLEEAPLQSHSGATNGARLRDATFLVVDVEMTNTHATCDAVSTSCAASCGAGAKSARSPRSSILVVRSRVDLPAAAAAE
jgi:hypothetical protein